MKSQTTTEAVALRLLSMVLMAAARTPDITTPATPESHTGRLHNLCLIRLCVSNA